MTPTTLVGAAAIAAPLLFLCWIMLRGQRLMLLLACALLAVGLGYLAATGAADDIGRLIAPGLPVKWN